MGIVDTIDQGVSNFVGVMAFISFVVIPLIVIGIVYGVNKFKK